MSLIAYALAVTTSPPQMMPIGTLEHPSLLALLAYWERQRGANAMPRRVEPRKEISNLLKHVHLCDVVSDGENFRFHLVGNAVFPGLENQTGLLVSEHPDMGVRLRFPILMGEVVVTKRPVRGVATRNTTKGQFHAESIWLPFGGAEVTQVLGMTMLTVANSNVCQ
jgi:hypothetical protein